MTIIACDERISIWVVAKKLPPIWEEYGLLVVLAGCPEVACQTLEEVEHLFLWTRDRLVE